LEVAKFEADTTLARRIFNLESRIDPLWRLEDVVESIRSGQARQAVLRI
jgi:hypothetical protein